MAETIKDFLNENQALFHSRILSTAINHLKDHPADSQKIIISDDFFNDFTNKRLTELKDFIKLKEKLELFIDKNKSNLKWCFFLDITYYSGDTDEFVKYCKNNEICFCSICYDIEGFTDDYTKFMNFIKN